MNGNPRERVEGAARRALGIETPLRPAAPRPGGLSAGGMRVNRRWRVGPRLGGWWPIRYRWGYAIPQND